MTFKRIISISLAFLLFFSLLPAASFAADRSIGAADDLRSIAEDLKAEEEALNAAAEALKASADAAKGKSVISKIAPATNIYRDLYDMWAWPRHAALVAEDGDFIRVEAVNSKEIVVETYKGKDFALIDSRMIPMELPLYGGFFSGKEYNFFVFGATNYEEDDSVEVLRVVKYSKKWDRIGSASLYGANTYEMFAYSGMSAAEANGVLYIKTAHTLYTHQDGLNHQASMSVSIRESDMQILKANYNVGRLVTGYVAHSFNQLLVADTDGSVFAVDHGDAYPRSYVAFRFRTLNGVVEKKKEFQPFYGPIGENVTGASLGGAALSSRYLFVAGNLAAQDEDYLDNVTRNVVLYRLDKSLSNVVSTQLTTYAEGEPGALTPYIVKIHDDRFCILWAEKKQAGQFTPSGEIKYLFINGEGEILGNIRTAAGYFSDCQPVFDGKYIVWYSGVGHTQVFYRLEGKYGTMEAVPAHMPEQKAELINLSPNIKETNPVSGSVFQDVNDLSWSKPFIMQAYAEGAVSGISVINQQSKTKVQVFAVKEMLTYSQFSLMIAHRAFPGAFLIEQQYFGTDWQTFAMRFRASRKLGIQYLSGGYQNYAKSPITRYEVAVMLVKTLESLGLLNMKEHDALYFAKQFEDYKTMPEEYLPYVGICHELGLLSGFPKGDFRGDATLTREQGAAVYCAFSDLMRKLVTQYYIPF